MRTRVAFLDGEGDLLAVVVELAGAEGDDLGFLGLLFRGVGDDDPAFLDFLLLDRLNEHPVGERLDGYCHGVCFPWLWCFNGRPARTAGGRVVKV